MLVNIGNMVINTQNITAVTEEDGYAVIYFVNGVPSKVVTSVSLSGFIDYLESVGVSVHG